MKLFDTYGYGMSRFVGQLGNEMSCTLKHEKLDFNRERKNPNIVIMGEAGKGIEVKKDPFVKPKFIFDFLMASKNKKKILKRVRKLRKEMKSYKNE